MNEQKMKKLIVLLKKHNFLFICFFVFIIVFYLQMKNNQKVYPYDSHFYYILSQSFYSDGNFSILNFNDPFKVRGIIFPLLLSIFNMIAKVLFGQEFYGWRILISLFSGIFVITFPTIFNHIITPRTSKVYFYPVPLLFILIIWKGLVFVPLSDLIAVYLLIFALSCINKAYARILNNKNILSYIELLLFILSGILFYAAYNTRTIYLFAFPFIFLILLINLNIGKIKSLIILLSICIGIFSVGCIQGISNQKVYGKFSLLVNTSAFGESGLFGFQLFQGMKVSLYETYMGGEDYLAPYHYNDIAGNEILQTESPADYSLKSYFKIVRKYPIYMLGLYTRHFLVLMNPINGGGYVYSHNGRIILTLFNYSLFFIIIIYLIRKIKKIDFTLKGKLFFLRLEKHNDISASLKKINILSLITILVPFIVIIPGAVEERFGLPFWLVIYGLLTYVVDLKQEYLHYKKHSILYIIIWLVGFMFIIALLTIIYASNREGIYLPFFDLW